ncbi:MAG: hypothetical protein P1V97_14530 [Planctomycetota bacterium]|nr:hypothetical protein [Planctomycetota bacterium]
MTDEPHEKTGKRSAASLVILVAITLSLLGLIVFNSNVMVTKVSVSFEKDSQKKLNKMTILAPFNCAVYTFSVAPKIHVKHENVPVEVIRVLDEKRPFYVSGYVKQSSFSLFSTAQSWASDYPGTGQFKDIELEKPFKLNGYTPLPVLEGSKVEKVRKNCGLYILVSKKKLENKDLDSFVERLNESATKSK